MFPQVILAVLNEQVKLYSEFEQNAIPHMDPLYNFALRICGNKGRASDLLKETYLKAFRFYDKLERGTDFKAWLFRVMRNAYLNSYSKKSTELNKPDNKKVEKFYEKIKASSTDSSQLEKEIHNNLTDKELSEALSSLPEDFRTVIILCDIESFNYEEMADFVDIPVGVVRSRLHKGRKMLFTKLYKDAEKKVTSIKNK
ncbi:MAG: sigma-70 family RNA polymerase sigma factor [Ignavibacteria bacterium]|nr:sigma-70 family RNA polymerase sigma factor [Ignavibacteria bacterium]